jgi:DNA helicase-2/ATP-dependent DNA helicase PcrA
MSTKNWSEQQKAIFANVKNSEENLAVIARAGTGKTTTIVEALNYIPSNKSVLLCAFNSAIAKELGERVNKSNVTCKTLHSIGFGTLAKLGRLTLDKEDQQLDSWLKKHYPDNKKGIRSKAKKLIAYAKNVNKCQNKNDLASLAMFLDLADDATEQDNIVRLADAVFDEYDTKGQQIRLINFDDMVWLPVFLGVKPKQFDIVMVDERQDMNACQNWLAEQSVAKGGKLIVVGDDRQAIYGFRGADKNSMSNVGGSTLNLNVTFRCGKEIVKYINELLPEIEYSAHESNHDGKVEFPKHKQMLEGAQPGDFIISRYNAPLLKTCIKLLAKNKPAKIAGKDILVRVENIFTRALGIDKDNDGLSAEVLCEIVRKYTGQKIAELSNDAEANENKIKLITDDEECVIALADAFGSLGEIRRKLAMLSAEGTSARAINCCTAHKSKGLETDCIWVLPNFNHKNEEEVNCHYVALTRGKKVLNVVTKEEEQNQ